MNLEGGDVLLTWDAEELTVLQQSSSGIASGWRDVPGTLGIGSWRERRSDELQFYRLLRRAKPLSEAIVRFESFVTEMAMNQLRRATDASFSSEQAAPLPPNKGDGALPTDAQGLPTPSTWASQPGMIRVYHPSQDGWTRAFKLYSSSDTVLSPGESTLEDQDLVANWKPGSPRLVDLNRPTGSIYPILDPRAATEQHVEGFEFQRVEGSENPLPMPVEWLYVLADQSLGVIDDEGMWQGEGKPSQENPIEARLAYWMDDETSKLNVNVASEGSFWDVPRADTPRERNYARFQPVRGEVQRYPGHPATTSLSSVLYPGRAANHPDREKRLSDEELAVIYDLTPQVVDGGSKAGTADSKEAVTFDDDSLYEDVKQWENRAGVSYLTGLLTTSNPSPETTVYGRPRMSIWPVADELDSPEVATDYDRRTASLSSLGDQSLVYLRNDSTRTTHDFYNLAERRNVDLYRTIMGQVYTVPPGYGKSLATKYGARLAEPDYSDDTDYDKDPYQIALSMFQHIGNTNMIDPGVATPYSGDVHQGFGQVSPISLADRDLIQGGGASDGWIGMTLDPMGPGRLHTLSEVALVVYVTSSVRINKWIEGAVSNNGFREMFRSGRGPGGDLAVMQRILTNQHPSYAQWKGRRFGPEDEGKQFVSIEVGLLPEYFSTAQGFPRLHARQSVRLLTGGPGFLGGIGEASGIKINGIPIELWGDSVQSLNDALKGPAIMTIHPEEADPRGRFPVNSKGIGGEGGLALFQFGSFALSETDPGYFDSAYLPNGLGPLRGIYCQSSIILREDEDIVIEQDAPMQLIISSDIGTASDVPSVIQTLNARFVQPDRELRLPLPEINTSGFLGWTRRVRQAAFSGRTRILEPDPEKEIVASLIPSHGDYRHLARRHVPSELLRNHPLADAAMDAHSLKSFNTRFEARTTYANDLFERGLVEDVIYADEAISDFTFDPSHRNEFSPLMSPNYKFPIDPSITRDFNTGLGNEPDGAYLNGPRDGHRKRTVTSEGDVEPVSYFDIGDFRANKYKALPATEWFPRRLAPSPVAMGSLSSALQANAPWTCLLFRPNVSDPTLFPHLGERGNGLAFESYEESLEGFQLPQMASVSGDPGLPPDHLWLDLFWMPTAEPNPVSTPFATEGKVNMNYQMMPFTHIKRATALHAALKAERVLAIPTTAGVTYKTLKENEDWRGVIDAKETLKQFEEKFTRDDLFLTESEICEQFLVPEGERWDAEGATMRKFWKAHRLSGDNVLERPYAGLYSRLTTRSNAYQLHLRVELIEKDENTPADRFDPNRDKISETYQMAKRITRTLDTDHPDLPAYARDPKRLPSIDGFYRYSAD